jgi:hypothetical protein
VIVYGILSQDIAPLVGPDVGPEVGALVGSEVGLLVGLLHMSSASQGTTTIDWQSTPSIVTVTVTSLTPSVHLAYITSSAASSLL